jgi:hypothetical protein
MRALDGKTRRRMSQMEAYDKLPQEIRAALIDADFNWSAKWLLRHWQREGTERTLSRIRTIEMLEKSPMSKQEKARAKRKGSLA